MIRLIGVVALCVGCAEPSLSPPTPASVEPEAPLQPEPVTRPGSDWPTFLGPTQDGVSTEKGILTNWPKEGLRKLWECELGIGYAPPVVADGRLFHFDRFGDQCRLTARDAATGKLLWNYEYPTEYVDSYGYDAGPRAGPVVDGERVYLHGPDGMLVCVGVKEGKEIWKVDTAQKYHVHQNFFGAGSVPVIDGDLIILPVGGSPDGPRPFDFRQVKPNGTAIVAFDKKTGEQKYAVANELASYSSPVIRTIEGKRTGLYFARGGLLGFDPQTGAIRFHHKWRASSEESVNAANPTLVGTDKILLTECYGPGAVLLEFKNDAPKELWSDAEKDKIDKSLMAHWSTPISHDGHIYGCSGRHDNDADIRCIELATGEVKWKKRTTYRCTFLKVDGHLVVLSEYGMLRLLKLDPENFSEVSRYEVKDLEYPCWAPPVLSHGILYIRGKGKLLALELIPQK